MKQSNNTYRDDSGLQRGVLCGHGQPGRHLNVNHCARIGRPVSPTRRRDRLHIGVVMLLVAGVALGLWLIIDEFRSEYSGDNSERRQMAILLLLVFTLGRPLFDR